MKTMLVVLLVGSAFCVAAPVAPSAAPAPVKAATSERVGDPDPVNALAANLEPTRTIVYKRVDGRELRLFIFEPEGFRSSDRRSCFVTIHGGGWSGMTPRRMYPFAAHFARNGMVGISVEYRLAVPVTNVAGAVTRITPYECVEDARSAVRYVRAHAAELGVDPRRLVANGGSAGGHLAAGTALFDGWDEAGEDTTVSCVPDALVLLFPVIDTSKEGYGNARLGDRWREISPLHRVRPDVPPTIIFHGTADTTTPFKGAKAFHDAMVASGNRCELVAHEGGVHGYLMRDRARFDETLRKAESFLSALGFLQPAEGLTEKASGRGVRTVRLLTVGNSFSQNATRYLGDLAAADGNVLVHRAASMGGATMSQHWAKVEFHERDPADPRGLYSTRRGLREELTSGPWDYVTLQQASMRSHELPSYRPYAIRLRDYIRKLAPKAEVLVHQTWAYRRDDPRFTKPSGASGEPATQEAMYTGLTAAYEAIAAELGARIIPVGDAFRLADTDAVWGYRPDTAFDFAHARDPALPDQTHSPHVGWQWKTQTNGTRRLAMDGHHAGLAGEYLAACVFYEVLFKTSAVANAFVPKGLDASYARFLREAAHKAVEARRRKPDSGADSARDFGAVMVYTMAETTASDEALELAQQAGSEMLIRSWFKWNQAPPVDRWRGIPEKAHRAGMLFGGGITCSALYDGENGLTREQGLDMATRGPDGRLVDAWGRPGIRHGSLSSPAYLDYLFRWCREQIDAGVDYLFMDEHTAALQPPEGYDDHSLADFRRYLLERWPEAKGWTRNDPCWRSRFQIDPADARICPGGDMSTFDYRAFLRARNALADPGAPGNPLAPAWRQFRAWRDARAWKELTDRIRAYARAQSRRVWISANGLAPLVDLQVLGVWGRWRVKDGQIDLSESQLPQWRGLVTQGHELAGRRVPVVLFHDWGMGDPPFPWLAVPPAQRELWMRTRAAEIHAAGAFFAFPVLGPFGCHAGRDGTLPAIARQTAFYRAHRDVYLRGRFLGSDALRTNTERLSLAVWAGDAPGVVRLHVVNRAAQDGRVQPRSNVHVDVPISRAPDGGASAVSPDWDGARPVRTEAQGDRLRVMLDELDAYAVVELRFGRAVDLARLTDPVRTAPLPRWEQPLVNTFHVRADGSIGHSADLNGILQGRLHTHLRNPPTFVVNARGAATLAVRVRAVAATGARLVALVDGQSVSETDLPDRDGKNDTDAAEYERDIAVPIPAGPHRLTLDNTGADWLVIDWLEFRGEFADAAEDRPEE